MRYLKYPVATVPERTWRADPREAISVSNLHSTLSNTAYIGYVTFNRRDSRTGDVRPEPEWVPIPVPPVVSEETFYAVRKQMADRDPRMGEAASRRTQIS